MKKLMDVKQFIVRSTFKTLKYNVKWVFFIYFILVVGIPSRDGQGCFRGWGGSGQWGDFD